MPGVSPIRSTSVILEALLLGAIGLILALMANGLSSRGLKLTRNYSPGGALTAATKLRDASTNGQSADQIFEAQFRAEGLQLADSNLVTQIFADAGKALGLVIFVDARDDEHFQSGHIPGAYQLDHYHPENYLAEVLPACQMAQKIVVYCKGGSCEDSEQTAIFLRDAGVPKDRLFVYTGGFDQWSTNRLPIELGPRNSGQLLNVTVPGAAK